MVAVKPCDRTDQHDAHGWGDPLNLVCWGLDFPCCTPTGPDCRDGKHPACDGRALDEHTDNITNCTCACHTESEPS